MSRGPAGHVREVGDSSLVLEISSAGVERPRLDVDVSRRATAIARAVIRRALPGVRDVIPTFRSVVVTFDPLVTDVAAVADLLQIHVDPDAGADSRLHEVPVAYGGTDGPDLEEVAAFAGCSAESVVERHASQTYRVFMLGFMPGFAYMGSVDEVIAAPRRATPRLRIPAGSVGIAGWQTGVYPLDTPGGWQIIGRTGVTMFDPQREVPSLFSPGDRVRFIPVSADEVPHVRPGLGHAAKCPDVEASRHVTVLRPGLLTTVQDTGRWGYQSLGVAVAGSMDPVAHRLANIAVGNRPEAATLEVTWLGPELRLEQDTVLAVAGGDLRPVLGGVEVPVQTPVAARAGSVLCFGERRSGARACVAFDGGIAVAPVLGSRATHLRSHLGGFEGRALKTGDRLPLGESVGAAQGARTHVAAPHATGVRLRVLPGPQAECFAPSALDALQGSRYIVSADSDRMGYRLVGGARLESSVGGEMVSDATFPGSVQIPPSGDPILLMADRPTTGGYPQIAVVISADLSVAAQLAAGDWVEFEICSRADAIAALVAQEGRILAAAR